MTLKPEQLFLGACLLLMGVAVGLLSIADCVPVSRYFLFLKRYWGRGALYTFLGILAINGSLWRILFGGATIAVGAVYLLFSCTLPGAQPQPLSGCTLCDNLEERGGGAAATQTAVSTGPARAGPFAKEAVSGAPRPFHDAGDGGVGPDATTTTTGRRPRHHPDNPFHTAQGGTPFDHV